MRVSQIGFYYNSLTKVLEEAEKSAKVTHNHKEGIKGAQAIAGSIFLLRTGHTVRALGVRIFPAPFQQHIFIVYLPVYSISNRNSTNGIICKTAIFSKQFEFFSIDIVKFKAVDKKVFGNLYIYMEEI